MPIRPDPPFDPLKISKMEIDCNKNWNGMGLNRIKQLASSMNLGDLIGATSSGLLKVTPGEPSTVLRTNARTGIPEFAELV